MKQITKLLIMIFALGACALTPLTPPPPALDYGNAADKAKIDTYVQTVNALTLNSEVEIDGGHKFAVLTLTEKGDILFKDNGTTKDHYTLHAFESETQMVYSYDGKYAGFTIKDGVLYKQGAFLKDYAKVNWDAKGTILGYKPLAPADLTAFKTLVDTADLQYKVYTKLAQNITMTLTTFELNNAGKFSITESVYNSDTSTSTIETTTFKMVAKISDTEARFFSDDGKYGRNFELYTPVLNSTPRFGWGDSSSGNSFESIAIKDKDFVIAGQTDAFKKAIQGTYTINNGPESYDFTVGADATINIKDHTVDQNNVEYTFVSTRSSTEALYSYQDTDYLDQPVTEHVGFEMIDGVLYKTYSKHDADANSNLWFDIQEEAEKK